MTTKTCPGTLSEGKVAWISTCTKIDLFFGGCVDNHNMNNSHLLVDNFMILTRYEDDCCPISFARCIFYLWHVADGGYMTWVLKRCALEFSTISKLTLNLLVTLAIDLIFFPFYICLLQPEFVDIINAATVKSAAWEDSTPNSQVVAHVLTSEFCVETPWVFLVVSC